MTPVERLQAAIERLETLNSTPPWNREARGIGYRTTGGHIGYVIKDDGLSIADAELIVTLHRTIDAQLAWLRDQLRRAQIDQNQQGIPLHYRNALALAFAILGDPA